MSETQTPEQHFQIQKIYTKDISFESPNAPEIFTDTNFKPDVNVQINTGHKQIGDDTLQRNAGRIPQPHTFTHGTSEQRQRWFATGFDTGDVRACDAFSARSL